MRTAADSPWSAMIRGLWDHCRGFVATLVSVAVAVGLLVAQIGGGRGGVGGSALSRPPAASGASCRDQAGVCRLVRGDTVVFGECEVELPECER